MVKKYLVITLSAICLLCGCSLNDPPKSWTEGVADESRLVEIPQYISANVPFPTISESEVALLGESGNAEDKKLYEYYMNNYNKFGHYDGLKVGYSGYEYFDIGNNCGFQVQHYGINQSTSDKITEIYYFDGECYTLIDSTGDNYANHNVLCDGERLYYLISDGILRSIDKTGSQTDYRDIYNTEEFYCPHIIMNGTENGIELIGYSTVTGEKEEIGIVEIK